MGIELVEVTSGNINRAGFFCKKSKRKTDGWLAKRAWWEGASADGMQTWIAMDGKRQVGFIEFAPAEATWRAVRATGHLVVHCVWVVGRAKEQGTGSALFEIALGEAERQGRGLAVVTSTKKGWLLDSKLVAKHGLKKVDTAPPCFELWAATPKGVSAPSFPTDWEQRAAAFGNGLTLVYAHQCPYVDLVRTAYRDLAAVRGAHYNEVFLESAAEVQQRSPSAYGVFNIVLDGKLIAWRWEEPKRLNRQLDAGP